MKSIFTKALVGFALLLFNSATHAQEYVITVNGDSIPCKIRFAAVSALSFIKGEIPNSAKYKAKGMKEYKPIVASEIKEYSFDDEFVPNEHIHFRAVYYKQENIVKFMQVLERGKINLFQLKIDNYGPLSNFRAKTSNNLPIGIFGGSNNVPLVSVGGGSIDWYISKGSDTVSIIKTTGLFADKSKKERKDDLSDLLEDKEDIYNEYTKENSFSLKTIRNAIHRYNTGKVYKDIRYDW